MELLSIAKSVEVFHFIPNTSTSVAVTNASIVVCFFKDMQLLILHYIKIPNLIL